MQCVRDESAMKNPWSWLECTLQRRAVQSVEHVATQRESREKATWVTSSLCPCSHSPTMIAVSFVHSCGKYAEGKPVSYVSQL